MPFVCVAEIKNRIMLTKKLLSFLLCTHLYNANKLGNNSYLKIKALSQSPTKHIEIFESHILFNEIRHDLSGHARLLAYKKWITRIQVQTESSVR